jgi:microcystin-dependent protein
MESYGGDLVHDPAAESRLEASGWLPCDGRSLSISDEKYSNLYKAIGKSWGGGSNTFNLPDLRGLFLRGLDDGAGRDTGPRTRNLPGGNEGTLVGTVESDEIGQHNHPVNDPGHGHDIQRGVLAEGPGGYGSGGGGGGSDIHDRHSQPIVLTSPTGISIGNNSGHETRPKNAAVNYIIRYR